jgi:hypothetical protein
MTARSQFTYPRSIQNDVADALATARSRVNADQLEVVDVVTKILLDTFFEHEPAFHSRADEWARRARYRYGTPRPQPSPTDHGDTRHG